MLYTKGYKTAKQMRFEAEQAVPIFKAMENYFGCCSCYVPDNKEIEEAYSEATKALIKETREWLVKVLGYVEVCNVKYSKKRQKYIKKFVQNRYN